MEQISPKNKVFIDWLTEHTGHELSWHPLFDMCKPDNMIFIFFCRQCSHQRELQVTSPSVSQWFREHEHRKRWRVITFKQDITLMVSCECGEHYTIKISE